MASDSQDQAPFGIIAGGGDFPLLCAEAAREAGRKVVVIAHKNETKQEVQGVSNEVHWIHLGQLGKAIKILKGTGCKEVIFAGTITKKRMFFDVRPDLRALTLWKQLRSRLDDSILRTVAKELEKEGIQVLSSTHFLTHLLTPPGILTKKGPNEEEKADVEFGFRIQKKIGELDIGQTIVVKDRSVLAVEAMEGTDETILRGGLIAKQGAVVVKVAKPDQDTRFDLPSAGLKTIETMVKAKARVLALEAGKSLFFNREKALELADRQGITVIGIRAKELENRDA